MAGKRLPEVMPRVLSAMQDAQRKRLKLEEKKEEPKITQVLEGYTDPLPKVPSVSPTLEERAPRDPLTPLQGGTVPPLSRGMGGQDIHSKTKAAIAAEQSQPTNGALFSPSKEMGGQKPASSFQGSAFRNPPSPPSPPKPPLPPTPPTKLVQPAAAGVLNQKRDDMKKTDDKKSDNTVVVKPAPAVPTPPPLIPKQSAEPTVKIVPKPADQQLATSNQQPAPKPPNPFDDFGGPMSSGTTPLPAFPETPNVPKDPNAPAPKDPFAIGDDGMTDIERALGGL